MSNKYFKNKEDNIRRAKTWYEHMETRFSFEIQNCVDNSAIIDSKDIINSNINNKKGIYIITDTNKNGTYTKEMMNYQAVSDSHRLITLHNTTTTDSLYELYESYNIVGKFPKIAILNFASYKNPGGMFIGGSMAQEESLCHESILYNVLSKMPQYYKYNKEHLNRGLYTNRAIYTPEVIFRGNNFVVSADVLTCAAPNKSLMYKYNSFNSTDNRLELESRIEFVMRILGNIVSDLDYVILGAFGCGVFRQEPTEVIELFIKYLDRLLPKTNVIFAVPGNNANYKAFYRYLKNLKDRT